MFHLLFSRSARPPSLAQMIFSPPSSVEPPLPGTVFSTNKLKPLSFHPSSTYFSTPPRSCSLALGCHLIRSLTMSSPFPSDASYPSLFLCCYYDVYLSSLGYTSGYPISRVSAKHYSVATLDPLASVCCLCPHLTYLT